MKAEKPEFVDYSMIESRIVNSSVLTDKEIELLCQRFESGDDFEPELLDVLNDSSLRIAKLYFREERLDLIFKSIYRVDILRELSMLSHDPTLLDRHDENIFRLSLKNGAASYVCGYLLAVSEPKYANWITGKDTGRAREVFDIISAKQTYQDIENLVELFKLPPERSSRLMSIFSHEELQLLTQKTQDGDTVDLENVDSMDDDTLLFLKRYLSPGRPGSIAALHMIDEFTFEQRRGVDETELDTLLLAMYGSNNGTRSERIAFLRSQLPRSYMDKLRNFLGQDNELGDLQAKVVDYSKRHRIALKESPQYFLRHLIPSIGYETEFPTQDRSGYIYALFAKTGLPVGWGGETRNGKYSFAEFSPGPFYSPELANATFIQIVRRGLVDVYRHQGQGIHTNISIDNTPEAITLLRLLQATGYAFSPKHAGYGSSMQRSKDIEVRANSKNEGLGQYLEFKEFSLTTPRNFAKHNEATFYIGAALQAYQRGMHGNFVSVFSPQDQEKLADIWMDTEAQVAEMIRKYGVSPRILSKTFTYTTLTNFYNKIGSKLPNWKAIKTTNFDLRGKWQAADDMPTAARIIVRNAVHDVKEVFAQMETDFLNGLQDLYYKPNTDPANLEYFFDRFPCGVTGSQMEESEFLRNKIIELYRLYQANGYF